MSMKETFEKIKALPEAQKALDFIKKDLDLNWEQHQELTLIPAFSLYEAEKAARFKEMCEEIGYVMEDDEVHNIYTTIKGTGNGPTVYITAHIDTVFPLDTPLAITLKEDGKYYCPGIGDDTASLANILTLMRAFKESGIKLKGDVIIGGNVGEEGLGDLYGMKNFFGKKEHAEGVDGFLSIDGCGNSITYGGTGSYRYKVTFSNCGGHSHGDFGMPNPIHAMGRVISKFADMEVPTKPYTSFSIGVVDGGTSVNSIAVQCSMLVDMRSRDKVELDKVDAMFKKIVAEGVAEENARWDRDREKMRTAPTYKGSDEADKVVNVEIQKVGDRPAGQQPFEATIVQATAEAYRAMGFEPKFNESSSVDANVPISMGIPGLAIGGGGSQGNAHSKNEWYAPTPDKAEGTFKLFLLVCGLCGVDGVSEPMLPVRNPK
ncbi:MAG: M20/M25/M40 family metallo-hydrolase [Firmicutes bacterium]|nr:M20/M25/M40 family metallo-hydrolase [Bacillota bacterium]